MKTGIYKDKSIIVCVLLHGTVVDDIVGLDDGLVGDLTVGAHTLHRGAIKIYLVVYD